MVRPCKMNAREKTTEVYWSRYLKADGKEEDQELLGSVNNNA